MARKQTGLTHPAHDVVTAFAEDVVAGRIVQGPWQRGLAGCHLNDLKTGRERGVVWDLEAALRKIAFVSEVAGTELSPAHAFAVGYLHGWKHSCGSRVF